jgi:hypothetical protein
MKSRLQNALCSTLEVTDASFRKATAITADRRGLLAHFVGGTYTMPSSEDADDGASGSSAPQAAPIAAAAASGVVGAAVNTGIAAHHSPLNPLDAPGSQGHAHKGAGGAKYHLVIEDINAQEPPPGTFTTGDLRFTEKPPVSRWSGRASTSVHHHILHLT